jgi:hypothetical protein
MPAANQSREARMNALMNQSMPDSSEIADGEPAIRSRLYGFHPGSYRLHLLPIRTEQTRRCAASLSAEQDELPAMVDQMVQELGPEHITHVSCWPSK